MPLRRLSLICALVALLMPRVFAADALVLAEKGRALPPVVISKNASAETRAVAAELARYLGRISGAKFEVITGDGATGIVLGRIDEFPQPGAADIARALQIRNGFDGKEAFVIRTQPHRLLLLGATDLGASHAAFRLLDRLGCRWFFPAKEWEVVPKLDPLRVDLNLDDRPTVLARRIWYGFGFFDRGKGRSQADYNAWARHNLMAMSIRMHCGHAWQGIIAANAELFEKHPEYRALITVARDDTLPPPKKVGDERLLKGDAKDPTGGLPQEKPTGPIRRRRGDQLCVSNPAVVELCKKYAVDFFKTHPDYDMVSMEPSDGLGYCECDECAKIGTTSDQVFYLANEVAKALRKLCPGKWVGLYAYSDHSEPPQFALEPNVYVQLTAGFIRGRYSFAQLLDLWPKKCRNMGYYLYFSVYLWDFDMLPGGYAANMQRLRTDIPARVRSGATSIDCESGDNWGLHGRGYHIANRLMWNPDEDVDALLADFYTKAFGPAAPAMKRYYERFDPSGSPLMSDHLIALGFRDVAEATRLAAGRPDVIARLDQIKIYLRYFHLRWILNRTKERDEQKRLTLAIFKHVYRTRYTHMLHWEAIRQYWVPKATKSFKGAGWDVDFNPKRVEKALGADDLADDLADPLAGPEPLLEKKKPQHPKDWVPWHVETPYTREEIDAFFQEGLDYFKPQPVEEKSFSKDLLPVAFPQVEPAASRYLWQGGVPYALWSFKGEPLTIRVKTGIIAVHRNKPPAQYSFLDAKGKVLAEGRLPLDVQERELVAKVPGPGLYFLDFSDSGAGWLLTAEASVPLTIMLRRDRRLGHCGWIPKAWFYVPKGTRQIQYYWRGGAHEVHRPDGALARRVDATGLFVSVPVPDGMDGRPWFFSHIAPGHLWFFNCPNYLAASPATLLVPRELVKQDHLTPATR